MKKVLIVFFCLTALFSHGQTKAETLDWIVEKVGKYFIKQNLGVLYFEKFNKVSQSQFNMISALSTISNDKVLRTLTVEVNLNNVIGGGIKSIDGKQHIIFTGHNVIKSTEKRWHTDDISNEIVFSEEFVDAFLFRIDFQWENDLVNRMDKAIKKLAAYNEAEKPKVKEPF